MDAPAEPAQLAFGGVAVAQRTDRLQLGGGPGELLHGAVAVAGGGQRSAGERAADLRLHDGPDARGELDRAARELGGLDGIAGVERDGGRGTIRPGGGERKPHRLGGSLRRRSCLPGAVAISQREPCPHELVEEVRAVARLDERHAGTDVALEQLDRSRRLAELQLRLGQRRRRQARTMAGPAVVGDVEGLLRGGDGDVEVPAASAARERAYRLQARAWAPPVSRADSTAASSGSVTPRRSPRKKAGHAEDREHHRELVPATRLTADPE